MLVAAAATGVLCFAASRALLGGFALGGVEVGLGAVLGFLVARLWPRWIAADPRGWSPSRPPPAPPGEG
jgi:hypothetical protein